jgi:hypothetical protein
MRVFSGLCQNATPFWAFLPNRKKAPSWLPQIIPWDGTLPPPEHLFKFGAAYFNALRNKQTVVNMLKGKPARSPRP